MIKNNMKIILAEKDITINKLAQMTGVRYATLHAFVKKTTDSANYDVMNKVCKVLNITPAEIFTYIED